MKTTREFKGFKVYEVTLNRKPHFVYSRTKKDIFESSFFEGVKNSDIYLRTDIEVESWMMVFENDRYGNMIGQYQDFIQED